ncbi:hypothetical protein BS47DRAFT_1004712 [Hydnum rufescens UP504]|uniref:Uncharacterized protein n=1 Tax=Hydnum rufescens UP504 TaxID=1448309 RepID=A0A9P6DYV5_9AGAM|nr:hypothetical protein BS47DRAFT_1004712 [Hydnum rufescens UP504]
MDGRSHRQPVVFFSVAGRQSAHCWANPHYCHVTNISLLDFWCKYSVDENRNPGGSLGLVLGNNIRFYVTAGLPPSSVPRLSATGPLAGR